MSLSFHPALFYSYFLKYYESDNIICFVVSFHIIHYFRSFFRTLLCVYFHLFRIYRNFWILVWKLLKLWIFLVVLVFLLLVEVNFYIIGLFFKYYDFLIHLYMLRYIYLNFWLSIKPITKYDTKIDLRSWWRFFLNKQQVLSCQNNNLKKFLQVIIICKRTIFLKYQWWDDW